MTLPGSRPCIATLCSASRSRATSHCSRRAPPGPTHLRRQRHAGAHASACHTRTRHSHPCWAEALLKIARMTLTIKRDGNWSSFQLANSALPLSVTSSAIAPSARMESLASSLARAPAHLRAPVLHASSVSVHNLNSGRTLYSCLRPCPSETTGQQTKARGGTN